MPKVFILLNDNQLRHTDKHSKDVHKEDSKRTKSQDKLPLDKAVNSSITHENKPPLPKLNEPPKNLGGMPFVPTIFNPPTLPAKLNYTTCKLHRDELVYYCETCDQPICSSCYHIGPHNNKVILGLQP